MNTLNRYTPTQTHQVDTNVTRHLDRELRSDDWSMMILHYLGLDHIGHLIGPNSHLIPGKLREMDEVVKKVHTGLSNQVIIVLTIKLFS